MASVQLAISLGIDCKVLPLEQHQRTVKRHHLKAFQHPLIVHGQHTWLGYRPDLIAAISGQAPPENKPSMMVLEQARRDIMFGTPSTAPPDSSDPASGVVDTLKGGQEHD
ncbi:hypothetical protein [Bifidobacterium xylocopae]|uniref:hypothetical protein n=1 Tax=Bifidobacterium xylocopae TaxID=2493119 RepID=UPI0013749DF7|nr:hypothetical protein [Bifidobacterium xylocopae]